MASNLNSAGTLVEQYTYDAFGAPTIKDGSGNVIPASAVGNRFMYKGREYLATLGVYDNRRRIYHPGLGKFLQVDPIRFGGSETANLYRFMGHNPLSGSDPMGEDDTVSLDDSSVFPFAVVTPGDTRVWSYPTFYPDQGAYYAPIADQTVF